MNLGKRIREVRKAQGLSQEHLARRADISLNVLNRIETAAVTDPHYSTLTKLAAAFDMPIAELLKEG
jgi:transcriptional regulator with XRE-family HTH domain